MTGKPFTTEDWLTYLERHKDSHLYEWLVSQANRGVDYFVNRLARLGLCGGRVLDAGCGAGNWAIALARVFEEVHAIDNDAERVAVLDSMLPLIGDNVQTRVASTEALPYPDASFDAVFCSGVIFVVDYQKTIQEFRRVLKPGGVLYASFVSSDWWRHVLYERSKVEPVCVQYGANGLISLYFRRLDEISLQDAISPALRNEIEKLFPLTPRKWWQGSARQDVSARLDLAKLSEEVLSGEVEAELLSLLKATLRVVAGSSLIKQRAADALRALEDLCWSEVPGSYRRRIFIDFLSRSLLARSDYKNEVHTYTFEPEDMTEILAGEGFTRIETAAEGALCIDATAPSALPIYERRLGVFEFRCRLG